MRRLADLTFRVHCSNAAWLGGPWHPARLCREVRKQRKLHQEFETIDFAASCLHFSARILGVPPRKML